MTNETHSTSSQRPTDETIKETFESIIIAFILAFVFRAYVVEAFVIPTGSMAPTLLGAHLSVTCQQCGYHFTMGWPDNSTIIHGDGQRTPLPLRDETLAVCPMCHYPNRIPTGTRPRAGDRILVHKYIYSYSNPRRWDVVVFKEPAGPATNYIKRLVGLPNEDLYIFQGNLYVRSTNADGKPAGDWHVARKTVRTKVQQAVWQPIYHSQYIPRDGGDRNFADRRFDWSVPWTADDPQDWKLANRRSYDYDGQGSGVIHFKFEGINGLASDRSYIYGLMYPYNQADAGEVAEPIEDVRISTIVQPRAPHVGVSLSTTARLDNPALNDGIEQLKATIHPDGDLTLEAIDPATGHSRLLKRGKVDPLSMGENRHFMLWYVDQEADVWVGGRRVLRWRYNLPLDELRKRALPKATPNIAIEVTGGPATLHRVEVDRDLYYDIYNINHRLARGALLRSDLRKPLHLGPNDFFCLGDNGPRSSDGRYWNKVNPWIEKRMLSDRVERGYDPVGIVPRDLMMGRAFFVYFPAPYSVSHLPIPDFGDMRFIN